MFALTLLWILSVRGAAPCHPRCMSRFVKHKHAALMEKEDGDVPGWVLITLMTAGLVIIIWALAGPALSGVFEQAIDRVVGF